MEVKVIRTGLGWTQLELARFLGMDRSSVSRMENGGSVSGPVERLLEQLRLQERSEDAAKGSAELPSEAAP